MFIWVFSLPLSLQTDGVGVFTLCFVVFFSTFAFLGLEAMSVQLEDTFGKRDNNVNCLNIFKWVIEDIYTIIHEVDGEYWAAQVREKMNGDDGKSDPPTEVTSLFQSASTESMLE